jgi:hypothetical protein
MRISCLLRCLFIFLLLCVHLEAVSKKLFNQRELIFQGVPLVIEEIGQSNDVLTIRVFDPADSVLAPQKIPFMKIEVGYDPELSEMARTDSLNGSQLIELVKYLQAEYGIPRLEVTDLACTLPCKMDGVLCSHEMIHSLSSITVYLSGKGFYERGGAVPLRVDGRGRAYLAATKFLHQTLRVNQLMQDLHSVGETILKASALEEFIHRVIIETDSKETDRISEVFERVRAQANRDVESHDLWHQLLNRFVGREDHCLLELSNEILSDKDNHHDVLKRFCAYAILQYVDYAMYLNGFPQDPSLKRDDAKREYYFDHQLEVLQSAFESFEIEQDNDDDEQGVLDATYRYRLDQEAMKNGMKIYFPYIPNLREIYYRAKAYEKEFQDENMEEISNWIELAEWIEKADDGNSGYLCLKWYAAREIIRKFNIFEFIL